MLDRVKSNDKIYETLLVHNSDTYEDLNKALEIVESFVKEKKRILYGGMAIDIVLKNIGHKGIYEEFVMPDYDFYSFDNVDDSNSLALLLHNEGFTNVSSINALHSTTRKVRIDFEDVADISYIPLNMYEKIPYLKVDGFYIVHPNYQMIDMHRSCTFLYENPPTENIFHRVLKDMYRYQLLINHFPINVEITPSKKMISKPIPKGDVIGGLMAYGFYYSFISPKKTIPVEIKNDNFYFPENYKDIIEPIIITDDFTKYLDKKNEYMNRILDIIPRRVKVKDITIYDNKGSLISASKIQKRLVVSVQHTLMHCLFYYYQTNDTRYLEFYKSMSLMIEEIDNMEKDKKIINSPLFLNPNYYGEYNWGENYIKFMRQKYNSIYEIKIEKKDPPNLYPDSETKWEEYDYSLLNVEGEETEEFFPLELFN